MMLNVKHSVYLSRKEAEILLLFLFNKCFIGFGANTKFTVGKFRY